MRPMADADRELLAALDRADELYLAEIALRTPGARVVRQDGLLLTIGVDPSPVLVNTIEPIAETISIDAIERAAAVYAGVGNLPSLWTRDHLDGELEPKLAANGWLAVMVLPGMITTERAVVEPPAGVEIRRVETERDRELWLDAGLRGFATDEQDRTAMRSCIGRLESLVGGPMASFYAVVDDRPVATAQAFTDVDGGIGIVGWVGTVPEHRRRGIGAAVSAAATNAGFEMGARTMSLQASSMGFPVYEKLGYRTITGYKVWFRPAA